MKDIIHKTVIIKLNPDIFNDIIRLEALECRMPIGRYLSYLVEFCISSSNVRYLIRDIITDIRDQHEANVEK